MIRTFTLLDLPSDVRSFWDHAVARNETLTPFHSYEWLSNWSAAYRTLDEAVAVVEYSSNNVPRTLLPMLHRPTDFRSLPLNATDYTGSIWQNRETESFQAIADYLQHEAKRMPVFLWNIRASDPLVECLTERRVLIHLRETKILFAEIDSCLYHPDRTQGSISVNELARKRKRLKDLGAQIRFSSHASGKELVSMIRIHMERWKQKGQEGNFADPCRVEFVQRLLEEPSMKLLFANMWLNGELLAYRLGPFDNRAYYDWNTGFNPAFKHFSPGVVLLESIFVHLKTNSNIKNLDFLRGTELYKYAWASSASKVHEYSVIAQEN